MFKPPAIAVVLEGGLVQYLVIEDWPGALTLPDIAIVDYDTEGADEDEISRFMVGDELAAACCHSQAPAVYGPQNGPLLSPRTVLAALIAREQAGDQPPALRMARQLQSCLQAFDARLNRNSQVPNGQDYDKLLDITTRSIAALVQELQTRPVSQD